MQLKCHEMSYNIMKWPKNGILNWVWPATYDPKNQIWWSCLFQNIRVFQVLQWDIFENRAFQYYSCCFMNDLAGPVDNWVPSQHSDRIIWTLLKGLSSPQGLNKVAWFERRDWPLHPFTNHQFEVSRNCLSWMRSIPTLSRSERMITNIMGN